MHLSGLAVAVRAVCAAARAVTGRHLPDAGRKLCGLDIDGQRMEVGEEKQALCLVLHPHPAQDRPEQIAEVQSARRLDAGNNACGGLTAHV